jgi:hypothetical protein
MQGSDKERRLSLVFCSHNKKKVSELRSLAISRRQNTHSFLDFPCIECGSWSQETSYA